MTDIYALAALWLGLALAATLLSIWVGIATAMSEIVVGTVAQLALGIPSRSSSAPRAGKASTRLFSCPPA